MSSEPKVLSKNNKSCKDYFGFVKNVFDECLGEDLFKKLLEDNAFSSLNETTISVIMKMYFYMINQQHNYNAVVVDNVIFPEPIILIKNGNGFEHVFNKYAYRKIVYEGTWKNLFITSNCTDSVGKYINSESKISMVNIMDILKAKKERNENSERDAILVPEKLIPFIANAFVISEHAASHYFYYLKYEKLNYEHKDFYPTNSIPNLLYKMKSDDTIMIPFKRLNTKRCNENRQLSPK